MLSLTGCQQIHLSPPRGKCAGILAPCAEQNEFGYVAKIEANAASIGAAVFANLVPNDVGLVVEAPCLHHCKTFWYQCVGAPKIEMSGRSYYVLNRQPHNLVEL